jgi:hypothetical protein
LAFDKYPALFTAVAGAAGVPGREVFEIIALRLVGRQTFGTISG